MKTGIYYEGSKPLRWDAIGDISYKDHMTNEEVRNRIQNAIGLLDDLLTMVKKRETQMAWSHLEKLWHGEDNSAGDSEGSKKEGKTEEELGR